MNSKSKLGILVLGITILGVGFLGFLQNESYSTEEVLDTLWDKYEDEVQSTQAPGGDFQKIEVTVYEEEDIDEVENYLKDNLPEEDLEDYKLHVYQWSSNPKEFRENAQENSGSDESDLR